MAQRLAKLGYTRRHLRKRAVAVQVAFAASPLTIASREGPVQAQPGDAIITGLAGERWRVSAASFAQHYQPQAPLHAGQDGVYTSVPALAAGHRVMQAFSVRLADGVSVLRGRPGDWLLEYGDGAFGVVSSELFDLYYEAQQ